MTPASAPVLFHGRIVPPQFPYWAVLLQGRPRHGWDDFALRHPRMDRGKRAKLFAPYDALDGYSDHVKEKNILYTDPVTLDEEEKQELNRRLSVLRDLTRDSRAARANRAEVTVRYFVPCQDPHSFAWGVQGQYVTLNGTARRVDAEIRRVLIVDHTAIPFQSLLSIQPRDPDSPVGRLLTGRDE